TDLVVFTDANAMLNPQALRRIVAHFGDPEVGSVAGEKRVMADETGSVSGRGEGLYWRYESTLKRIDATLWSAAGAAGELFAVRSRLWTDLPEDTLLDDFVVSLRIAERGYRIAYAPDAWAAEAPSLNLREEWKRKVRIAAGGLQAIGRLPGLLGLRSPRLTFAYVSHRVLRWTVIPLLLPILPVLCVAAAASTSDPLYTVLSAGVAVGLVAVAMAARLQWNGRSAGPLTPFFYFAFMNAAVWAGAVRLLRRRQQVTWERAARHGAAISVR
ncbi:MAG: glycosyltransferase family 2 protein, partial [Synechococcaceae cyanobacterium]|nr:glycosyltransferase family 2 protein [Synechococcaceae cyanobacterium]